MKKWRRSLAALAVLLVMMLAVSGCSSDTAEDEDSGSAQETAEESGAEEETDGDEEDTETVSVDFSAGMDEDGNMVSAEEVAELVTLPDYRNIVLAKEDVEADEDEVASEIDSILSAYVEDVEVTDRPVQDGDTVNIDYVGSVDGEEFDGGSAEGVDLVIGSGSYIDGFEDGIIGHEVGETFDLEVTFPDPYSGNEDLSGRDAVFVTTINSITESVTPELTDDFVAENLSEDYDCSTAEELTQSIRDEIEESNLYTAVWEYLLDSSSFGDIPEDAVEARIDVEVDYYKVLAAYYYNYYGTTWDEFLTYALGVESEDALREELYDIALREVERYLISQAIVEEEEMSIGESEVRDYCEDNGHDYDDAMETYGSGYLTAMTRLSLIYDLLEDTVTIE